MEMRELARIGAEVRIKELEAEIAAIRRAFPAAAPTRGRPARNGNGGNDSAEPDAPKRRRKMSAAARKAISAAQKARWAKQRSSDAADTQTRVASKKR